MPLSNVCQVQLTVSVSFLNNIIFLYIATPKGASVPSLGLSNKAVYEESVPIAADKRHIKDQYPDNYFVPITMNGNFNIFYSFLHLSKQNN